VPGCQKLTEHGVRMLVANCAQLRSLWVPTHLKKPMTDLSEEEYPKLYLA
jgi:hypothetical protein